MTRLIVTPADASALQDIEFQVEDVADPAPAALAQPSAVLITKNEAGAVLIATIRQASARQAEELAQGRKVVAYTATGFLGLSDEAVYDETPEATEVEPKKRWWQRRGK